MRGQLRVRVLIGIGVLLAVVLIWRIASRRGTGLEGLSPDAAEIEKHRRRGNVEALARIVNSPKADVATLATLAGGGTFYIATDPEARPDAYTATMAEHDLAEVKVGGDARLVQCGHLARGTFVSSPAIPHCNEGRIARGIRIAC